MKKLEQYADLCTNFFQTHNIFQQKKDKILTYLETQTKKNKLLTNKNAGMILIRKQQNKTHSLWKFRHFAYKDIESAKELIKEAERIIKKSSKTNKIELTIAESEGQDIITILKDLNYEEEGILKNHYRWGEITLILSKSIP